MSGYLGYNFERTIVLLTVVLLLSSLLLLLHNILFVVRESIVLDLEYTADNDTSSFVNIIMT